MITHTIGIFYVVSYLCPSTCWENGPSMKALQELDPALHHGDIFLPGLPHLLYFRLHVSPPGVSWPSSFPLSFFLLPFFLSSSLSIQCIYCMFLYSAVLISSTLDVSEPFTLHLMANLFIPMPTQLLWEGFSHAAIAARRLLTPILL